MQPKKENFKITLSKSFLTTNLHTNISDLLPFFLVVRYFLVTPGFKRPNNSRCQSLLFVVEEKLNSLKKNKLIN